MLSAPPSVIGRYELHARIAKGGMATVYVGRKHLPTGLSRTVAVKRMHSHLAEDAAFAAMFLDEARLAMRLQHPNIVPTFDVEAIDGELLLVMEYVHGESLSGLMHTVLKVGERMPPPIASAIMCGVLEGLNAAHEARGEAGTPLSIVHRDVSPQNILVGGDGVARLLDFGIAKAFGRTQSTSDGQIKGKLAYMAPEQLSGLEVDRRTDIFAASVVLWEILTGKRAFQGDAPPDVIRAVMGSSVAPPSSLVPGLGRDIDDVVMRGLARDKTSRFPGARDLAAALEKAIAPATARTVSDWVNSCAAEILARRAAVIEEVERQRPLEAVARGLETSPERAAQPNLTPPTLAPPSGTEAEPNPTVFFETSSVSQRSTTRRSGRKWMWALLSVVGLLLPLDIWERHRVLGSRAAPDTHASDATESSTSTAKKTSASPLPIQTNAGPGDAPTPRSSSVLPPATPSAIPAAASSPAAASAARAGASRSPPRTHPIPASKPQKSLDCSDPFLIVGGLRVPREDCFQQGGP